jgi:hypothetical protein
MFTETILSIIIISQVFINWIGGVMVSMLTLSVLNQGFKPNTCTIKRVFVNCHWNVTCSHYDMAEKCSLGGKQ